MYRKPYHVVLNPFLVVLGIVFGVCMAVCFFLCGWDMFSGAKRFL